jgi:hypothetical protein
MQNFATKNIANLWAFFIFKILIKKGIKYNIKKVNGMKVIVKLEK